MCGTSGTIRTTHVHQRSHVVLLSTCKCVLASKVPGIPQIKITFVPHIRTCSILLDITYHSLHTYIYFHHISHTYIMCTWYRYVVNFSSLIFYFSISRSTPAPFAFPAAISKPAIASRFLTPCGSMDALQRFMPNGSLSCPHPGQQVPH